MKTRMKTILGAVMIVGMLAMLAAPTAAQAQYQTYGVLSNSSFYTNGPAGVFYNTNGVAVTIVPNHDVGIWSTVSCTSATNFVTNGIDFSYDGTNWTGGAGLPTQTFIGSPFLITNLLQGVTNSTVFARIPKEQLAGVQKIRWGYQGTSTSVLYTNSLSYSIWP